MSHEAWTATPRGVLSDCEVEMKVAASRLGKDFDGYLKVFTLVEDSALKERGFSDFERECMTPRLAYRSAYDAFCWDRVNNKTLAFDGTFQTGYVVCNEELIKLAGTLQG